MSSSAKDVVLVIVCPMMGMIISNLMFSAPYRDLKKAIDRGELGDLNPTPWAFMLGNCFGWVTYSMLIQNLWIFFANCPGFILSIWLNLGATKLMYQRHHSKQMRTSFASFLEKNTQRQDEQSLLSTRNFGLQQTPKNNPEDEKQANIDEAGYEEAHREKQEGQPLSFESSDNGTTSSPTKAVETTEKIPTTTSSTVTDWANIVWDVTSQMTPAPAPHERMILFIVVVWTVVISIIAFGQALDKATTELIVGTVVNLNLVFFYGSPLSTIFTVLRERNSSSIHIPTMITNTLNGTFWLVYGFAVMDFFIFVPNGLVR
jgi:solute carrier family 50 (sugar transporter)